MPDPQPWEQVDECLLALTVENLTPHTLTEPLRQAIDAARSADQAEIARLRQEMKRAWGRLANHLLDHRNDGLVWEAADIIAAALTPPASPAADPSPSDGGT